MAPTMFRSDYDPGRKLFIVEFVYAVLYTVSRFYEFDEYDMSGSLTRKCIAQVIIEMHSGFQEREPSTESFEIAALCGLVYHP